MERNKKKTRMGLNLETDRENRERARESSHHAPPVREKKVATFQFLEAKTSEQAMLTKFT